MRCLSHFFSSEETTTTSWLAGFSGILMVRFFLEALSNPTLTGIVDTNFSTLLHLYLFFIALALAAFIFFWFAVPNYRKSIPILVIFLFVLVLVAPVVDFLTSGGAGVQMTYLFDEPQDLFYSFLTFFGPLGNGITLGIRVEVVIAMILVGFLIQSAHKNFLRTVGYLVVFYSAVFLFVSLPSLVALTPLWAGNFTKTVWNIIDSATLSNNLHGGFSYAYPLRVFEIGFDYLMGKIWFLFASALALIWFFLSCKEKTLVVFRNSRLERVVAHLSVVSIGVGLAFFVSPPISFSVNDVLSLIILYLSFYFSWMFAVFMNDLVDEKIDRISNPSRPLVSGNLSREDLKSIALLFLIASLAGAYLAGYYALFLVLAFTALYYIYSVSPTRLKQIPFFSSFLIALCFLAELMAGFFLISNSKELNALPKTAVVGIVVLVFLWSHVRDLKDVEGDRAAGIRTVPVVFGRYGFDVVAVLVSLAYLLVPFFTENYILFVPAVIAAIVTYFFIKKKPYRELNIFIILFIFLGVAAVLLLL